ncbi:MAG: Lrp/AsnC family transcriptional regulator [Lentisphaeria bacterium]|nr:Lrp/AsnC family transcriptional regulator [Lentisphaeria bacterium]
MDKTELRKHILRLLGENGRLQAEEIAERIDAAAAEVEKEIRILEQENVIIGYRAIFDEAELPENAVKAIIEVKVKPEREGGFDKIAKRLSRFPQVSSLYLMSGPYDLQLEVKGKSLNDVAYFVSSKLSTVEGVLSTSTHFLLKKYKESGKLMLEEDQHERLQITP